MPTLIKMLCSVRAKPSVRHRSWLQLGCAAVLVMSHSLHAQSLSQQHQVQPDETLWRIAIAIRPSTEVSMDQVLQAIVALNPTVFPLGDINQLPAGAWLQLPTKAQILAQQSQLDNEVVAEFPAKATEDTDTENPVATSASLASSDYDGDTAPTMSQQPMSEQAEAVAVPVASAATQDAGAANQPSLWQDIEWFSQLNLMPRWYSQTGLQQQSQWHPAASFEFEAYWQSDDRSHTLVFSPYLRWDQQDSRRHLVDISEAYWLYYGGDWELRAGINKVFWGAVESQRLVDVINQRDLLDRPDGESKLGQPMLQLSLIRDFGTLQAFALPYFRERRFAGDDGRLRLPLPVDTAAASYQSRHGRNHLDWALRWSQQFRGLDLGLSYFQGTSREPVLLPAEAQLQPYYPQLKQAGLDAQWILGAWLWKTEAVYRHTDLQHSKALVSGFEYTQIGINEQFWDLGWLLEYQYDSRGIAGDTIAQNDLFVGWRLALNDAAGSEILLGFMQDLDRRHSRSAYMEASTRLGDRWRLRVDGWLFHSRYPDELLFWLRRDDYIQLTLEFYF
ncbi:FimV/HubP family polar landmark protein [Alkalimonas delamerensis]|uniref:FimV/HubP family polar landmark protein n=1 Tax=Alkalimonas delamerensis TaxID=265981 RepID=A0ABT9GSM9_9GAMM|nr:FimV/HubP family polar landmark protein [Alkalimonas delamerensis]MDP4529979.1 FimV/HubP family polar landmark protein [Alkalimonas delamerensis]